MPDWLTSAVIELRQNFRLADAVDILIIAVFLYAVILWCRREASRRMLLGVLLLGIVYLLAKLFDNYAQLPLKLPGDKEIKLSAAFGVAVFPDMADNGDALVQLADQEMYQHKRQLG